MKSVGQKLTLVYSHEVKYFSFSLFLCHGDVLIVIYFPWDILLLLHGMEHSEGILCILIMRRSSQQLTVGFLGLGGPRM